MLREPHVTALYILARKNVSYTVRAVSQNAILCCGGKYIHTHTVAGLTQEVRGYTIHPKIAGSFEVIARARTKPDVKIEREIKGHEKRIAQ